MVQEGWCKYWSHWDADPPRFQANLVRNKMRVGKAGAKYTSRAPNESVTEGFTGYESYGQSDTASDHFSNLEDIQRKNRDDPKGYKADVEGWMKKIAQDKGNEYNLDGFEALGLISKDLLFQRIITASGVNIKPLARKAIQSISKDLKRLTSGKPAWHEEDQIKGYHAMIRALKRFV